MMKWSHFFVMAFLILGMVTANAKELFAGWSFFAPNVADEQDLNGILNPGDIVYDASENKFFGKVGAGNSWVEFGGSTPSNRVETSANVVWAHESAFINSADVVSRESGDWINGNCTNSSTGKATCNFNSGTFSDTPNCVCTVFTGSSSMAENSCFVESVSASSVSLSTTNTNSLANQGIQLICHGPR